MNTIVAILVGALVWQTIAMIVCVITNENEDITLPVCFGVWTIIFSAAGFMCRSIRLAYSRRYNCYQVYGKPNPKFDKPCHWWLCNVYMTPKTAEQFRSVDEYGYEYAIKLLRTGKEFKSCPYKQEIVKEGDNFPACSDDFMKNFKKNP